MLVLYRIKIVTITIIIIPVSIAALNMTMFECLVEMIHIWYDFSLHGAQRRVIIEPIFDHSAALLIVVSYGSYKITVFAECSATSQYLCL